MVFTIYVVRLALYVCLKNICDGVGGQDESNGTPLDPPLFWLDNIFNAEFLHTSNKNIDSRNLKRKHTDNQISFRYRYYGIRYTSNDDKKDIYC
jgi:hypothetical protein